VFDDDCSNKSVRYKETNDALRKKLIKCVEIPFVAVIVSIHILSVLTDRHIKNVEYVS
jgi:type II secretory pathway component PulF